jgi:hypothetical protein
LAHPAAREGRSSVKKVRRSLEGGEEGVAEVERRAEADAAVD